MILKSAAKQSFVGKARRHFNGATTFSIMSFTINTLSINVLIVTLSRHDTQHNNTVSSVIMPNVMFYLLLCLMLLY
jgi:hypothetical protein